MGYSLSRLMPPPIKGVDGSVVGLGFTVVSEDDYEYEIVRARVSASFWRENVTAVVTLLGVLAGMSYQMLEVSSYFFNNNNSANFSGEKKQLQWSFPGCQFFGNTRIKL